MAQFTMRPMNDLNGKEQARTYPHLVHAGVATTEMMAEELQQRTSFTTGDIKGLLESIGHYIAQQTANGYSVKLDGIGTFHATLGLTEGAKAEAPGGTRRNSQSIRVRSVAFRPSRQLIARTQQHCFLERKPNQLPQPQLATREERLAVALQHIARMGFLRVMDYAALTGLARSTAARELKALHAEGLLETQGSGSHKVYVKP